MGRSVDPSGLASTLLEKIKRGTARSRFQEVGRRKTPYGDLLIAESWNPVNSKWDMQWICRSPLGPAVACVDPESQFLSRAQRVTNTYERALEKLNQIAALSQLPGKH